MHAPPGTVCELHDPVEWPVLMVSGLSPTVTVTVSVSQIDRLASAVVQLHDFGPHAHKIKYDEGSDSRTVPAVEESADAAATFG